MLNNKLDKFKAKLSEDRQAIVDTINFEDENGADDLLQSYYSELSVYDNHPADIASETYEAEMRLNLKSHEKRLLNEIDNALSKFDNGSYGICEKCGKKIEFERLEVLPSTRFCVECKDGDYPLTGKIDTRPVEEEVLNTPYNRTFNDGKDKVSFDGEDSFQAAFRYNDIPQDPSYSGGDYMGYFDREDPGIVEDVEQISEDYYNGQIEGLNRTDIPDWQRKDLRDNEKNDL